MEEKSVCCPYCGGELEDGVFHATAANKLMWVPENMKVPALAFGTRKMVEQGAVMVECKRVSSNAYISAKYCRECAALIMKAKN